jgi:hypothetical protein
MGTTGAQDTRDTGHPEYRAAGFSRASLGRSYTHTARDAPYNEEDDTPGGIRKCTTQT